MKGRELNLESKKAVKNCDPQIVDDPELQVCGEVSHRIWSH